MLALINPVQIATFSFNQKASDQQISKKENKPEQSETFWMAPK